MDANDKTMSATTTLAAFAAGELTEAAALAALLALGADPADADELLFIAGGGDDVIEEERE
jgi:hypothetical protein